MYIYKHVYYTPYKVNLIFDNFNTLQQTHCFIVFFLSQEKNAMKNNLKKYTRATPQHPTPNLLFNCIF